MAAYRLHRGIDARDVARAHDLALLTNEQSFRVFVISGATPFLAEDVFQLKINAPLVIQQRAPDFARAFAVRGWQLPESIDRVYSSAKAQEELGWLPRALALSRYFVNSMRNHLKRFHLRSLATHQSDGCANAV